jgi:uncharacterized protein (UPF0332 family)
MKSRDDHLKQAKSNETYADQLLQTASADALQWAVSVLYYAAVHYGRAFLVASGAKTITTHIGFETYFGRHWKKPPDIFPLYRRLKDDSEAARYDCIAYSAAEVQKLKDVCLVPFRDAVCAALGISP